MQEIPGDNIPIPAGFRESTEEGETEIDDGKVVIAPDGSEFVWVPVPNAVLDVKSATTDEGINALIKAETDQGKYPMALEVEEGIYKGVLYYFHGTSGVPSPRSYPFDTFLHCCEPSVLGSSGRDTDAQVRAMGITGVNTKLEFGEHLQEEYNRMVESVATNKGFYIGRYETSIQSGTSYSAIVQSKGEVVSMNRATWYGAYANQKEYAENHVGAQGGMIWGSQWDQVMVWMKDIQNEMTGKPYIVSGTGMGWSHDNYYAGNPTYVTGKPVDENSLNKVKNIWDISGNMEEWSMEAVFDEYRQTRGR